MNTRLQNNTSKAALDMFIDKVMEPLPDEVLVDTHYNSLLRIQRRDAWVRAQFRVDYYKRLHRAALHHYAETMNLGRDSMFTDDFPAVALPPYDTLVALYREALAVALVTPVCRQSDIKWKQGHTNRRSCAYGDITDEDIERAIAEDEQFLRLHPTTRKRGVRP